MDTKILIGIIIVKNSLKHKGDIAMICEFCSLSHPRYINRAWPHSIFTDKEEQAKINISRMLYYTENCAKALIQGFERFENDQSIIKVVISGKCAGNMQLRSQTAVVIDLSHYPVDTLLSETMSKVQPLVIENLRKMSKNNSCSKS